MSDDKLPDVWFARDAFGRVESHDDPGPFTAWHYADLCGPGSVLYIPASSHEAEVDRLDDRYDALLLDCAALREANERLTRERDEAREGVAVWNKAAVLHAKQKQAAEAEAAALRKDAERLDWIERCIRDGSYASILNDVIAVCRHAYGTIGPGPALRTAIDAARDKGE